MGDWVNASGEVVQMYWATEGTTPVAVIQPGVQVPVVPGTTYILSPGVVTPPITGVVSAQGESRNKNKKKKTVQVVNEGLEAALQEQREGMDRAFNLRYAKPQNPFDSAEMNRPFTRLQTVPLEVRKTRKYGREDADSE